MYEWGSMHNFMNFKINDISSIFSDIFYSQNLNYTTKINFIK